MVMVKQPFCSGWASGSIAKTITCRALFNNRFCMHKFRHTQQKRSPLQLFYQSKFAKQIRLGQNFYKVSERRSARLNKNWLGIAILGASEGKMYHFDRMPPLPHSAE